MSGGIWGGERIQEFGVRSSEYSWEDHSGEILRGINFVGDMSETFKLAVNGTLMRGLALNPNLTNVGATFECETETEAAYRLWSIGDAYPAMLRVADGGVAIAVEVWQVPAAGLGVILSQEPAWVSDRQSEIS